VLEKKYFKDFEKELLWKSDYTDIFDKIRGKETAIERSSNIFEEILSESDAKTKTKSSYETNSYSQLSRRPKEGIYGKRHSAMIERTRLMSTFHPQQKTQHKKYDFEIIKEEQEDEGIQIVPSATFSTQDPGDH